MVGFDLLHVFHDSTNLLGQMNGELRRIKNCKRIMMIGMIAAQFKIKDRFLLTGYQIRLVLSFR